MIADPSAMKSPDRASVEKHDGQKRSANQVLHGYTAIVTGAGNGIGRAIASELAGHGALVSVVDIDRGAADKTVEMIARAGGQAVTCCTDVTDPKCVDSMLTDVQRAMGPVDILVNNVGGVQSMAPLAETDPVRWWGDVELNLRSAYLCARAVLPSMIDRRSGRIINVASNGAVGPWPLISGYAAAKAAVVSMTQSLARETAGHGLSVFALHPGYVHTGLVRRMATALSQFGASPKQPDLTGVVPPGEAARLCVLLAAGHADHLSGHFFADASDTVEKLFWRNVARLALVKRDVKALMLLCRSSSKLRARGSSGRALSWAVDR